MAYQDVVRQICDLIDRERQHGARPQAVRMHSQLQRAIVAEWAVDYSIDGEMHLRGLPLVGDDRVPFGTYELV